MVSIPAPPFSVSLPLPPSSESLSTPPSNESLPVPPTNVSLPASPFNKSLSVSPFNESLPVPPVNVSFPFEPLMVSLPPNPLKLSALVVPVFLSLPAVNGLEVAICRDLIVIFFNLAVCYSQPARLCIDLNNYTQLFNHYYHQCYLNDISKSEYISTPMQHLQHNEIAVFHSNLVFSIKPE
ncbi:hypothetical protein CKO09_09315 [Chromatium weissei]|nr:hypothetical protein [Chromatium weissei]